MKKIDFKIIAIILLVGLNTFQFFQKQKIEYVSKIVEKEVPVAVHDTIPFEVELEVPYEVEIPVEVEKLVEVKTPISADTLKIINDYLAQNKIADTIKLKNNWGYMIVNDVVSKNQLQSRNIQSSYNIPTKEKIVQIEQPKVNQWYLGFGLDYSVFPFNNGFNGANTKLLYKTKSDKMFGLDVGFRNNITNFDTYEGIMQPYIGTSILVKLN
jgi:hypothetical protein